MKLNKHGRDIAYINYPDGAWKIYRVFSKYASLTHRAHYVYVRIVWINSQNVYFKAKREFNIWLANIYIEH